MGSNLVVPLDKPTYDRLQSIAITERRSMKMQASMLLRKAVGLPIPDPEAGWSEQNDSNKQEAAHAAHPGR